MYQEHQENVDHHHQAIAARGKTNSKTLQKAGQAKMTCDLKHMVESIERVASGQQWIDTLVASDKIRQESSNNSSSSSDSSSSSSSSDSSDSSSSSSSSGTSSGQSSSSSRKNKTKTKSSQSIHLRNRSVKRIEPAAAAAQSPPPSTGSRRRPNQRRRLACLNAMAKVHCLYENEIRQPLTHKHSTIRASFSDSDSDNSDDDDSCSSSDSSEESQTVDKETDNKNRKTTATKKSSSTTNKNNQKINRKNKKTERKRPASKIQPASKKQRQSMEVPVVDLAALVMPKRMASLNATAILAASSQQWPDSPKPRRGKPQPQLLLSNSDVDSEDETKKRETKVIPSSPTILNRQPIGKSKILPIKTLKKKPALSIKKNISCVESCSTSTAASTSTNSQILRLSANIFHQEIDGHQTTTTKTGTYHQSLSSSSGSENNGNSVTSSSKTYQRQMTTTSSNNGPLSPSTDPTQSILRITPNLQVSFFLFFLFLFLKNLKMEEKDQLLLIFLILLFFFFKHWNEITIPVMSSVTSNRSSIRGYSHKGTCGSLLVL
jgi:hypothetical protein